MTDFFREINFVQIKMRGSSEMNGVTSSDGGLFLVDLCWAPGEAVYSTPHVLVFPLCVWGCDAHLPHCCTHALPFVGSDSSLHCEKKQGGVCFRKLFGALLTKLSQRRCFRFSTSTVRGSTVKDVCLSLGSGGRCVVGTVRGMQFCRTSACWFPCNPRAFRRRSRRRARAGWVVSSCVWCM